MINICNTIKNQKEISITNQKEIDNIENSKRTINDTSSIFSNQMKRKNRLYNQQKKINVYLKTE